MGRRRSNAVIVPWLSARADNREKRFIQVGDTLLHSPSFKGLHAGAQHLYFCMAMESAGRRYFQFPTAAASKYGISSSSFWNYVQELTDKGFILCRSNKNLRKPNDYSFTEAWKAKEAAPLNSPGEMAICSKSDQNLVKALR